MLTQGKFPLFPATSENKVTLCLEGSHFDINTVHNIRNSPIAHETGSPWPTTTQKIVFDSSACKRPLLKTLSFLENLSSLIPHSYKRESFSVQTLGNNPFALPDPLNLEMPPLSSAQPVSSRCLLG